MFSLHGMSRGVRYGTLTVALGLGFASLVQAEEDKGSITLAYVEWASEVASTNVVRAVLEEQGYDVTMTSLSAAAMWQALAHGDADAIVAAWLPTTHADYFERVSDSVEDLGPNLDGTKLGLVVPAYTDLESVADINDHVDALDGQIIGIDPGAGLMSLTEEALDIYGLNVNLRSGSDATMVAALASAISNEEDIVVTSWTPHWMFARWDLKYLEDPEGVFGGDEQIHTVARQGLSEDSPEAYTILSNFSWTPDQMGEVMLLNQEEGADPYESAKQWVADNPDVVEQWLAE